MDSEKVMEILINHVSSLSNEEYQELLDKISIKVITPLGMLTVIRKPIFENDQVEPA